MKRINNLWIKIVIGALFLAFTNKVNAREPHWQIDANSFQYDMQMYISLIAEGAAIERWEDIELAAFSSNHECRGIAQVIELGQTNKKIYSLRVRSNSAKEIVSFCYYDQATQQEYNLQQTVAFISDGEYGSASQPFVLSRQVELIVNTTTNAIYVAPNGSSNGSSPTQPTGDLQAALNKAFEKGASSVRLASGEYLLPQSIQLKPGIHIIGEGQSPVVLNAQGQSRVIEINQSARATTLPITLYNLTLSNGFANGDGGGALLSSEVTVDSCRFIGNQCTGNGGGVSGGKVIRSLFQANKATEGGAVAQAELNFCTLVHNESSTASGAAWQSKITNSIIWGNGGGAQLNGCTLTQVALEAEYNKVMGQHLIYLSSHNRTDEADGRVAPDFTAPETNIWSLSNTSPLSKAVTFNGNRHDLGAFNGSTNTKRWLALSLTFQKAFTFGENILPKVEGKDIWGEPHTDFEATMYYRTGESVLWETGLPQNAGSYQVKISISHTDARYQSSKLTEQISIQLTILPKKMTVTVHPTTKVYGTPDPELQYTLSEEFIPGNALTGKLQRVVGEDVGDYAIERGTLSTTDNYTLDVKLANLTITPRLVTILANNAIKTYGNSDPALTYTLRSEYSTPLIGKDACIGTLARTAGETVGSYPINIGTLRISDNYKLTMHAASLTIQPLTIAVIARPQEKTYGQSDPTLTYTLVPALVGNDLVTGALQRTAGENAGTYSIQQGDFQLSENYAIKYSENLFTILPAAAEIEIDGLRHVYNRESKQVEITTQPAGLRYLVTYDDNKQCPSQIGTYSVIVTIDEHNYRGERSETMYIAPPEQHSIKCTKVASLSNGATFETAYEELVSELNFKLFDQRGRLIHEDTNYQSGEYRFDGLAASTYFYVLTYSTERNEKKIQRGFIELVP